MNRTKSEFEPEVTHFSIWPYTTLADGSCGAVIDAEIELGGGFVLEVGVEFYVDPANDCIVEYYLEELNAYSKRIKQ